MSKKKKVDDRKQLLIRYKIDEKGCVSFIDPCCDDIPVRLFGKIIANKVNSLPPNITIEKPTLK